jgi:hypothetical protein
MLIKPIREAQQESATSGRAGGLNEVGAAQSRLALRASYDLVPAP